MSNHTPGPWKYDPIYDDGSMLRQRLLPARIISRHGDGQQVAEFTFGGVPSYADAILMAAAPEMLEALKVCAVYIGNMPHPDFVNGGPIDIVYAQALQAIAKAEGRDQEVLP